MHQIGRDGCLVSMGRKCTREDYAPFQSELDFLPCDERRPSRGSPLSFGVLPEPRRKADGHHQVWEDVKAGIESGDIPAKPPIEDPASFELKKYSKQQSSNPSTSELRTPQRQHTRPWGGW